MSNIPTRGFTLGRAASYDEALRAASGPVYKVGKCDNYSGGWLWSTPEEADKFRQERLSSQCADWVPQEFAVYELRLPNGVKDFGPPGEDGVARLLVDAIVVKKVKL